MALQVLLDLYDRYKVRHVAWYLARQGILVRAPISELLIVDQVPGGLPELRERYRKARSAFERRWHGGTNVRCVLWLWDLARRHGGPLSGEDFEPLGEEARDGEVRAIESSLAEAGIKGTLDAIRGWTRDAMAGRLESTRPWRLDQVLGPDISRWIDRASALHPDP
jgi:hypothetical protein